MKIKDIQDLLEAKLVVDGGNMDLDIHYACGADMMSDVLAYLHEHSILLTGLCNPQVVRTAEMMDIECIVFVRGKQPDENMKSMAKERNLTLMVSEYRMFTACGKLYEQGMRGGDVRGR